MYYKCRSHVNICKSTARLKQAKKYVRHVIVDLYMYKLDAREFQVPGPLYNMHCVENMVRVLLTLSLNVVWYRNTCACVSFDIVNSLSNKLCYVCNGICISANLESIYIS